MSERKIMGTIEGVITDEQWQKKRWVGNFLELLNMSASANPEAERSPEDTLKTVGRPRLC
ncbi:hypothetical protein DPMN_088770 [Dreissena polymorpha]|uniref:Uncharacterized protein n=1 Tax=Dreissena polymorpha TaxID=45954 RepID=A0A9D4KVN6_DREPO|nr:hypothetical protein DPMN_088770 [Dreissena polymorpha]